MTRRVAVALGLALVMVVLVPNVNIPQATADEVAVATHLNPWSINGALFSRESDGVANVDIVGTCAAAYEEWVAELAAEHEGHVSNLRAEYEQQRAANVAAIAAGEAPPFPLIPPAGSMTESTFISQWLAYAGIPSDFMDWVKEVWEPMEFAPGTDVPCFGRGVLPAPPGGFLGFRPGDEPVDPDPCAPRGQLPFSPAVWTWYPAWHEDAPVDAGGSPSSGIASKYSAEGATLIISFIPVIIGIELQVECLAIFPGEEATGSFAELLPAAQLTIVPEAVGLTGAETKLWYDFSDTAAAVVGPITVGVSHRGTDWTLTAYAWVDAVGWDLDFDPLTGANAVWDESIDFPDTGWIPAPQSDYAAMGGSFDEPARIYVYEAKDNYTVATGVTWRGYYVVETVGGLGWGFTEQYDPVTRWTLLPYQVDEIVGRRN